MEEIASCPKCWECFSLRQLWRLYFVPALERGIIAVMDCIAIMREFACQIMARRPAAHMGITWVGMSTGASRTDSAIAFALSARATELGVRWKGRYLIYWRLICRPDSEERRIERHHDRKRQRRLALGLHSRSW